MPKYLSDTSFRAFPQAAQWQIKKYLDSGGKLFVSGAYIGTDLEENKPKNHPDIKFANEVLKLKWRTNHASKKGIIKSVDKHFSSFKELKFNNTFNKSIYKVEAPDAIEPASSEGKTVFRYSNSKSAGVAYKGKYSVISLGFPFETILEEKIRVLLMKDVIRYFNSKRN